MGENLSLPIGAALLLRYLGTIHQNINFYIPNRLKEGYGLNEKAVRKLKEEGTDLIITVDNGISSVKEAKLIKDLGMDLIITDHHEEQEELPEAVAVCDPKRKSSTYPFRELCGAGVVFKIILALDEELKIPFNYEEFLQMTMISTIADLVPLVDENRIIAKLGLESVNRKGFIHKGLARLKELKNLNRLNSGSIGYMIAPMINAAGRLGRVQEVMTLLVGENLREVYEAAKELYSDNEERKRIEEHLVEESIEVIKDEKLFLDDILIVSGKNWHSGVIGIVASRIQESWNRPVITIGIESSGLARGSCRSISGFDIFRALSYCKDDFITFGGHELAAGFSIDEDKIPDLTRDLKSYCSSLPMDEINIKKYHYDKELEPKDLNFNTVKELESLEPFGIGNPAPLFKLKPSQVSGIRAIGSDKKHLQMKLDGVNTVFFGKAHLSECISQGTEFLVRAEVNRFRGRENSQYKIVDYKTNPETNFHEAKVILEDLRNRAEFAVIEEDFNILTKFDRKLFITIYNLCRASDQKGFRIRDFLKKYKTSAFILALGLEVLKQAELIEYTVDGDIIIPTVLEPTEKKDLKRTKLYRIIKNES